MLTTFHRAVADTLVDLDVAAVDERGRADVVGFVDGQLRALPAHLAFGVTAVAAFLAVTAALGRGRPFRSLPAHQRRAAVERWAVSPLPPVRLYVRMLRSLVVYSGHEVLAASG